MDGVHIRVEQRTGLRLHVVDEPDRVIGVGQGADDGAAGFEILFRLRAFFGNIRDEDIIDPAVLLCHCVVAVVVHPAELSVLAPDTVLYIVHVVFVLVDLLADRAADRFVILRVNQTLEGISGQCFEILRTVAAKDVKARLVCVEQLFRRLGPVDEEAAWHVPSKLLDYGERGLVQFKAFSRHGFGLRFHASFSARDRSVYRTAALPDHLHSLQRVTFLMYFSNSSADRGLEK